MYSLVVIGTLAGFAAGALGLFLSYVAPMFGAGNFIAETPESIVLGRKLSRRESHVTGMLLHLIASGFFGFLYAWAVQTGFVSGFTIIGILVWSLLLTLFAGLVLMPLEVHGLFGRRHDAWFMADAMLAHLLWGFAYLALVRLWLVG